MWNYDYQDGSGAPPSDGGDTHSADQDNESILTDMISPSGHADAQTLACILGIRRAFYIFNLSI